MLQCHRHDQRPGGASYTDARPGYADPDGRSGDAYAHAGSLAIALPDAIPVSDAYRYAHANPDTDTDTDTVAHTHS